MVQVQCWWSKVLKPNSFEGFADVGWFHVPKVVKAQKLFSQCSGLNKCIQLRLKKMPSFIWLTAYIMIVLMDLTSIFKLSTSWRDMLHFSTIGLNLFTNNWTFVWGIYRREMHHQTFASPLDFRDIHLNHAISIKVYFVVIQFQHNLYLYYYPSSVC